MRRKSGKWVCSGCGRGVGEIAEVYEREVRDLPCFEYRATVVVELYRVRCPDCGVKTQRRTLQAGPSNSLLADPPRLPSGASSTNGR